MKIRVEVTQEDINLGCKADAIGARGGCMVHRAFMRATEGAFPYVSVEADEIMIHPDPDMLKNRGSNASHPRIELPGDVQDCIADFDGGYYVEPFAFDIDLPIEVTA